jgi:hypothetical protein
VGAWRAEPMGNRLEKQERLIAIDFGSDQIRAKCQGADFDARRP